jgi:hypothetical protein
MVATGRRWVLMSWLGLSLTQVGWCVGGVVPCNDDAVL